MEFLATPLELELLKKLSLQIIPFPPFAILMPLLFAELQENYWGGGHSTFDTGKHPYSRSFTFATLV